MALREVNGWGFLGVLSFAVLFAIFVVRFAGSLSGVPVSGFNPAPASAASNWVIVALAVVTMFSLWRYNRRPYKLDLSDMFKDNAAWAGFFMALMMGLVAFGAIYRLY